MFAQIEKNVDTNFTLDEFKNNIDLIFKYAANNREVNVITRKQTVGKTDLPIIDETATCDIFAAYKRIYN